ncbi:gamma-glutamyltransferase [Parvibaculaceae bacterium PLY_AMNH_Bact1]|nr:gamma-glutamyltransferase [Parvibaculaceae bacterium PLY_AMNH_Bact1]
MRPNFDRAGDARRNSTFSTLKVATVLGFAVGLASCGSLLGSDEPDTSAPLGSVTTADRTSRGLTGVGRASAEDNAVGRIGGFVVADEPQAVLIARDVLEQGGTVVDAAVSLYFALSVTQPQAASLGGGGICLVHDRSKRLTESVEFLPRRASAGGAVAIPGNIRGFALMHARYGRTSWSSLLAPAERLAATGTPVSRAMARSIQRNASIIRQDQALARGLLTPTGLPLKELDDATQIELASTLGLVRSRGVSALYAGDAAQTFATAIAEAGGNVSADDLRNYRPVVNVAGSISAGSVLLHTPSASVGAGAFAEKLWGGLQGIAPTDGTGAAQAANALALQLGAQGTLPDDLGSTGFAVSGANGDAVACAVTSNGTFGTGRTVSGMGLVLARSPDEPISGLASAFLAPVIAIAPDRVTVTYVGASGGGPAAVAGVQQVARQLLTNNATGLADAISSATPGAAPLVNAISCPVGGAGIAACEVAVDPDGAGLGAEAIGG